MDGFGFVTALRGNSTSARHRRYSIIHLADLAFPSHANRPQTRVGQPELTCDKKGDYDGVDRDLD
jgi:hypothetical protein